MYLKILKKVSLDTILDFFSRLMPFVLFLFLLAVILQPVRFHLSNVTYVDDGFYYLGYARNIAAGNGATFDGEVKTNGVQPFWSILLVGVATIFPRDLALMQATLGLSLLLGLISYVAMRSVLKHFFTDTLYSLTTLLYLAFIATPPILFTGMETSLNLACFTLALALALRIKTVSFWPIVGIGCMLALTVLSRIDNLIMMPTFALLLIWSNGTLFEWRKAVKVILWLALPVSLVFIAYLIFNLTYFDTLLPISGTVKSTRHNLYVESIGGHLSLRYFLETTLDTLAQLGMIFNYYFITLLLTFSTATILARLIFVIGLVAISLVIIKHRKNFDKFFSKKNLIDHRVKIFLALAVAANLFLHTWLQFFITGKENAFVLNWYYIPWYVFMTIGLGFLFQGLQILLPYSNIYRILTLWSVVSLVVAVGLYIRRFEYREGAMPLLTIYEGTQWANNNLPPQDKVGAFNAGVAGYFSENSVINLDGLMNNYEIIETIKGETTMTEYLEQHDVRWIMDYAEDSWSIEDESHFRGIPTQQLGVVYRTPFKDYGFVNSFYYVIKFTHSK